MSDTLTLASQLIACPSITPLDHGCQSFLAERLKKLGFEVTHFQFNQVSNLWARRGQQAPLFCFAGHTDVVPPGNIEEWQSPPFVPTIRDGILYGRGSADMKSSIAAMVTACERFLKNISHHQGSIAFLITSDEEGPADEGTVAVLKELAKRQEIPNWCLVGEASSTHKLADTIKIGRRGSMTGYLKIHGIQGHVAYPQLAKNPIHLALAPLKEIADFHWDEAQEPFPASSLQFANINAGTGATNVIPGLLTANFNIRYAPTLTPTKIQETVENILKKHQCQYELAWQVGGKPFYTSSTSHLIKVVNDTIETTLGYAPIHSTSGGTSDGRFFAEYGCEVVEVGPNNATIHKVNECISVEELDNLSYLYEKILMALLG